jgi:hypothetical protein
VDHLSEQQILAYKARTLSPSELLHLDDHISSCSTCRDRMWSNLHADRMVTSLRNQLHATADPSARRKTPVFLWAAAAAILVIAIALAASRMRSVPETPAPPVAVQPAAVPDPFQEVLDRAKREGTVERATVLDELIRKEGTLLAGSAPERSWSVVAPAGTVVLTDRPWLKWQTVPGATRYVVSIFDTDFNKVASSPALTTGEWQPSAALPRGRSYSWQVTATVKGEAIRFPRPPAPEAVFRVLEAEKAAELEKVKQARAGDHLLLGILYSKEGLLDEAETEFRLADPAEAKPLLESLARIRR